MVMSGPVAAGGGAGICVPQQINHQGVVAVNGQRFNGNGDFKFALVAPRDRDLPVDQRRLGSGSAGIPDRRRQSPGHQTACLTSGWVTPIC